MDYYEGKLIIDILVIGINIISIGFHKKIKILKTEPIKSHHLNNLFIYEVNKFGHRT